MQRIRLGMWVLHKGRVGIVSDVGVAPFGDPPRPTAVANVHFTDALGVTVERTVVRMDEVAQASYGDIPEVRRPPESLARALHYL